MSVTKTDEACTCACHENKDHRFHVRWKPCCGAPMDGGKAARVFEVATLDGMHPVIANDEKEAVEILQQIGVVSLQLWKAYYEHKMGQKLPDGKLTVRLWDGMDGVWCDVIANVDLREALASWLAHTDNGTKKISFGEIDYYCIFPAGIRMLHDSEFPMNGDDR